MARLEPETIYAIREIEPDIYEVSSFVDGSKESISVYKVKKTTRAFSCNCPGFWRQRNKDEHKHCLMVKFWIDNLEKELGCCFWFDGDDIEYRQFITNEALNKWLALI